ncbi:uncharacterized protein E0L32_011236 [Thyridium curvatum]|uniref:Nucleolar complex protein 2 n=1 Tax=Thyridium curvatum TaxID=1093900 RepID=A0A507B7C7_9PEZI|nr:uncharacterized protein E0L32_011236 [Thyridium curvatum]TPX19075.1 hypothetical protein E0L32_011236 [Thyridium curvatum]
MATSKKNLKATKKFEKKHLKSTLERRKEGAKIKQRVQIKAKKQAKRAKDDEFFKGKKDGEDDAPKINGKNAGAKVAEMSVDDFFKGGFEIIDKNKPAGKKGDGKLGKRKRDQAKAQAEQESESDSGDDEDFSADEAPVASDSEAGDAAEDDEDSVGMTKSAMDALAEKDPEFYKYLKENDPEALEFDENADLAEIDELSNSEGEEEQPKKKRKKEKKVAEEAVEDNELTLAMITRWKQSMAETHSLRAAREVVLAFRSAAYSKRPGDQGADDADDDKRQKYTILSPDVRDAIVLLALKRIPEIFEHHVPVKESAAHKVYVATTGKKFKTLSIMMRTYTTSILRLLGTLTDDGDLKLAINAILPLLPYLLSFRKLLKHVIKAIVGFWAQPASSESLRITAFLVLRRLMVIGDKGVREALLKAVYQGLIEGCRATNINTIQGVNLMKNSAAELWGIDQGLGYTTAFSFIRQLAIHLRNSIAHNQNDSFRTVYNWQYVHSLDFWSCVLAEHCSPLKEAEAGKESQLKLLIYPLVQVTLGAMRLIPTATYFPLRFHLIRSLLRVSRATGTYIPLASALIEVLNSAEMKKPPKAASLKPLDFSVAYRAPKSYLRTRIYQDGVGEQVVELLSEYFVLWSTNIAFPEFSLPVIIMLKRWLKDAKKKASGNKNGKLNSSLTLLIQKLEANSRFIEEKRARVDFAPKDRAQVDAFLKDFEWEKTPVGAFVVSQRKLRAEKAKMMQEARKEDERKRKEEKEAEQADQLEDDEEEDEFEDEEGVLEVDSEDGDMEDEEEDDE